MDRLYFKTVGTGLCLTLCSITNNDCCHHGGTENDNYCCYNCAL